VTAADKGTLFLDEIAELPESSQAALLRVLQEGEVKPLGAATAIRVDVRVLAATHRNLAELVAQGKFRDDLHARLRGHVVHLPPLRSRREDIGIVVADLLQRAAGARAPSIVLQRTTARALLTYRWPHNIRELEQVLTRALNLAGGNEIGVEHLPDEIADPNAPRALPERDERKHLAELLRKHRGNVSAVARELATSRTQVERLLARHDLDDAEFRPRRG
jgi:transcriptional regulator of acetoin/glycerol metabolism